MEKIHTILNDFSSSNEDSINQTKIKLKSISSDELLYYIWSKEPIIRNVPAISSESRKKYALVKAELDIRATKRQWNLIFTSTGLSGLLGILGVFVGSFL